jgi:PAS domain S-box-containing protein
MGERQSTKRSTFESASFKVAERDYRILIDSIRDYAIFMLGPDGRVETWNAGAAALHGYSADEVVCSHLALLHCEEDRATGQEARQLTFARLDGRSESEGWRIRKDGTRFWASSVLTALWDGERLVGFAEVTRDLSARREADEANAAALSRAQDLLREAQRMESVGRLSAAVAHDFNNALSVILTYCDLLTNDLGPAQGPVADVLEIQKAAARAARLTQHLLTFSRRRSLAPEAVDLNELVVGIEGVVRKSAGDRVALAFRLQRPLPPALGDRLGLEQALLHLVANARDAMRDVIGGGQLTIATAVEPVEAGAEGVARVVLTVTDTGVGMDEATQARCFEPFFTTKAPGEAAGLGLALVQATVRHPGGQVRIQSAPGKGTTVSMYLPVRV